MAKYRCDRCGATGDDEKTLDHAIGTSKGRPCVGYPNAPVVEVKAEKTEPQPTPTKKIEVQVQKPKETTKPKRSSK